MTQQDTCAACKQPIPLGKGEYNQICMRDKEGEKFGRAKRWANCLFCVKCNSEYKSPEKAPSLFD